MYVKEFPFLFIILTPTNWDIIKRMPNKESVSKYFLIQTRQYKIFQKRSSSKAKEYFLKAWRKNNSKRENIVVNPKMNPFYPTLKKNRHYTNYAHNYTDIYYTQIKWKIWKARKFTEKLKITFSVRGKVFGKVLLFPCVSVEYWFVCVVGG